MKNLKLFSFLLVCMAVLAMSCEGPMGPAGADGTDGTDGLPGSDGTDGVDGNVTCLVCHSGAGMDAIQSEFWTSQHYSGDIAVDYAGGRGSCAPCHSHEQFVQYAATGSAQNVSNPSAWKCQTCHNIHTTFEAADYAFRLDDAVTLNDGTVFDEGSNNVCATCHQSRRGRDGYAGTEDMLYTRKFTGDDIAAYTVAAVGPNGVQGVLNGTSDTLTVVFDVPFATYAYISSTHAGPHHGPQADVWSGVGGATAGTAFGAHGVGCVGCHMDDANHSFKPQSATCEACHSDGTDKEDDMDAINDRLEAIAVALDAKYFVHIDDEWESGDALFGAVHPVYASGTIAEIDAWFNFTLLMEDRSMGAHNPVYADALLDAAETALGI